MGNKGSSETDPDEANKHGKPYQHDPDWTGPVKKRSCTDVLCFILFLVLLGAWGFVGYLGFSSGDINKLIHPTDSAGQICGYGDLKDRPVLLFFDLTKCLNPAVLTLGCPTHQVCIKECPKENLFGSEKLKDFCSPDDASKCPQWVLKSTNVFNRCIPSIGSSSEDSSDKNEVIVDKQVNDGKDITKGTILDATRKLMLFTSVQNFVSNAITDLADTYWMIGIGLLLTFLLCMLWIFLMRFIAGILIWSSITILFVLFGGLFGYSVYQCDQVYKKNDENADKTIFGVNFTPDYLDDVLELKDTWLAFSIISGIFTLIIILIFIALRKRISLAIALLDQGAKAVGKNYGSIFWPIVPFVLHLLVFAWFGILSLYLSSSGTKVYSVGFNGTCETGPVQTPCNNEQGVPFQNGDECTPPANTDPFCETCPEMMCQFTQYKRNLLGDWRTWFNLFAFFWTMEFVTALGEFVLASTFSQWYWTHDKNTLPCCSIFANIATAFYHLGTLAFGSLIIGIIRFIQAILNRIEKTLGKYNNDLTKCLLCVCKCCFWCLEKFMRFINKNAYIMCAIKSTNFCVSAKDAFSLLMRNMVRVIVLNSVVSWLLWFGKLTIVAGVGTLSYFFFSSQIPLPELEGQIPVLNHGWLPTALIVIGSYYITTSFFCVYNMAVDTLFLCLLEDLERNDGSTQRPYFAPKGLLKVVNKMQKFDEHDTAETIPLAGKENSNQPNRT